MTKQWTIENYMIAFLDVLGQSDSVLNLSLSPITEDEKKTAAYILYDTAEYILGLRAYFDKFFKDRNKPSGLLDGLPQEKRKLAEKMRSVKAECRGFSDSIVIIVPLSNDNEHCIPTSSIYSALFGICGLFVAALQSKKPFRGGIDIGWGVHLTPSEIYGSALVKAVKLESKEAKYPRVVVGNSLWEYLTMVEKLNPTTILGQAARKHVEGAKSLITTDQDSIRILDVIGNGAHAVEGGLSAESIKSGYEFIVEAHNQLSSTGNTELSLRYGQLRNYFESRLYIWNLQPVKK